MKRILIVTLVLLGGFVLRPQSAAAACPKDTNGIRVITRDANGTLLPNMTVAIYHKLIDPDGNPYFGPGVLSQAITDAGGQTNVACLSAKQAPYAVKVYQKNPLFGYFAYWEVYEAGNLDVSDVEVTLGGIQTVFRDAQGTLLKNVVFDVFLQSFDVDGEPVIDVTRLNADKLVASDFNTQVFGTTHAYLNPGHYVIRIHGTGNAFFYVWNQEVNAEEETFIEYHLGTMRFVFENGFSNVVKNQQFAIYRQIKDVRGAAIYGDVVASGLSTKETGKFDAYLPPGTYALRVAGSGGTIYKSFGYKIEAEQYKFASYRMSGVRVVLRGPDGDLAHNLRFSFATQRRDALGRPVVNKYLLKSQTTGEPGYVDLYVPAGTYILVIGLQRLTQIDVFDKQFTSVDWPRTITFRVSSDLSAITPIANKNFHIQKLSPRRLPSSLGDLERITSVYNITADTFRGRYQVVMTTTQAKLDDIGLSARRLKIAYYNARTKRWSLVGTRNVAKRQVTTTLSAPGMVALVAVY